MEDIVLVTADSVRADYIEEMPFVSSQNIYTGTTAAHYTRPSLAALLSASYRAAIRTQPVNPTLPEVLSEAGYTCIGLAPTPQTDPEFGFGDGFDVYDSFYGGSGNALEERTSSVREFFGQFDIVRQIYRLFFPMGAVLEDIPSDERLVDRAIEEFHAAEPPRFLWLHLMGSHRPYGTGDEALPTSLDRKAERVGGGSLLRSDELTEKEQQSIDETYRRALGRVDAEIERLLDTIEGNPVFAFTSDHGEELGEEGYYYHQGYRRRVPETIVQVPAVFEGLDIVAEDTISLIDIAPTLVSSQGLDVPDDWHGRNCLESDPSHALTIAPWHDTATVLWQTDDYRIESRDTDLTIRTGADETDLGASDVSEELEQRLKNLGYVDAG